MGMLEDVAASATGQEAETAEFYLKRMEVLRRLLQFGDKLLDTMVKGGAVDFTSAKNMAQQSVESRRSAEPEIELIEEEIEEIEETEN
jgi:polyhydroxyalkanoate synthesis regulator phasin